MRGQHIGGFSVSGQLERGLDRNHLGVFYVRLFRLGDGSAVFLFKNKVPRFARGFGIERRGNQQARRNQC